MVPAKNPPNKIDHSGDIKKNNGPKIAPKIIDKEISIVFIAPNIMHEK